MSTDSSSQSQSQGSQLDSSLEVPSEGPEFNSEENLNSNTSEDITLEKEELATKKEESSCNIDNAEQTEKGSNNILDNEARLQQLEQEHETLKSQYMRIAADFDNFRKRQTRDNDDMRLQLTCNTLTEILPVVDNFERARQQLDPEGEEAQALHRSYQGLYKQLVDVLKQLGVAPMRVVGQVFDPNLHEAVMREPSDQHSENVVLEELQRGYHLDGRVLRHALVKVSMGPGPNKNQESEETSSKEASPDQNQEISDSVNS